MCVSTRHKFTIRRSRSNSLFRSQQHQSRVGLVTYALLTLVTALFILSDMTGPLWKHRVALVSRNIYEVSFRLIEIGLALWFPCVLWNCVQPQQLWILNPKRLLMRKPTQIRSSAPEDLTRFSGGTCVIKQYHVTSIMLTVIA